MARKIIGGLIIITAIIWSGCQQQQGAADVQKNRLLVLENKELKERLKEEAKKKEEDIKSIKEQFLAESKKRDEEIKKLINQHKDEIQKLNESIKQCKEELSQCEEIKSVEMQKESDKQVWDFVTELGQKNDKLAAEVERLNAELARIKGQ